MNVITRPVDKILVSGNAPESHLGRLSYGDRTVDCVLGRSGIGLKSVEGDGLTPIGTWPMRRVLYRSDRIDLPVTQLPAVAISPQDGWCDAPQDTQYNQLVKLPYPASHEDLWRNDNLYDVLIVLGFNDDPVVPDIGSAIFLHLASPDCSPTEGCIAVQPNDMLQLLAACHQHTLVEVLPSSGDA